MNRWTAICLILPVVASAPALAEEPGGLLEASREVQQAIEEMEKRFQEVMQAEAPS